MTNLLRNTFSMFFVLFTLTACNYNNKEKAPISAESLISQKTELVSFSFSVPNFERSFKDWITKDRPSKALLSCNNDNQKCEVAAEILSKMNIPFSVKNMSSTSDDITLYYNSDEFIDCDKISVMNDNFGCANSRNVINMMR